MLNKILKNIKQGFSTVVYQIEPFNFGPEV